MAFIRFTMAQLEATVVKPTDDLCTALKKVAQAQRFAYQYQKFKYREDGSISDEFCAEIKQCLNAATGS